MNAQENLSRYGIENPNKFDKLCMSWVVGVIDSNGVAHSQRFYFEDALTHEDIFPLAHDKRWRWDYDRGITTSICSDFFDKGDWDIIMNHMRREYGVRFYSNGFHDIEYFMSKLSKYQ